MERLEEGVRLIHAEKALSKKLSLVSMYNHLCTYDLYGPVRNVFDAGRYIYVGKWGVGLALEISSFLGPKWHEPI